MFLVPRDIFTHDNSPSTAVRRNFYNNTDVWKSKYLLCRTKFYRPVGQWNLKFHFRKTTVKNFLLDFNFIFLLKCKSCKNKLNTRHISDNKCHLSTVRRTGSICCLFLLSERKHYGYETHSWCDSKIQRRKRKCLEHEENPYFLQRSPHGWWSMSWQSITRYSQQEALQIRPFLLHWRECG